MASNADYTQEYFDIMAELNGDIEGRRKAHAYMEQSTAIVHHQVVASTFVPRLYNRKTYDTMKATSTTAHKILCKVMQEYLDNSEYRELFDFDPRLEELIMLPRGYDALLPFARVDIFLNEDDYTVQFCEFNADGSSGMNEDREIVNSIEKSESYTLFSQKHQTSSSELFTSWVEEFLTIYKSYTYAQDKPHVAICDFLDHAVIDEFKLFAELFGKYNIDCSICDVRDLSFDGEKLFADSDKPIDAIWRRCVTNDIIDHWEESQNLIKAVRAEKVALIGSFAGHVVHDKQIFRILFMPQTQSLLTEEENVFVNTTVPYTNFLDEAYINLDTIKTNKDEWIIKPTDHYGADQVYAGTFHTQDAWEELIDNYANKAAGTSFIVQKYCIPFKTLTIPPDSNIEDLADDEVSRVGALYNNLSGLYLYNGRFVGVFSRLGPLPTISKDMKGITAATIWVDC